MDDLTGTADQRMAQLRSVMTTAHPSATWLARQLELCCEAWRDDETTLLRYVEARVDF